MRRSSHAALNPKKEEQRWKRWNTPRFIERGRNKRWQALTRLAAELELCGHYDLALDCQESVTAVRNGNWPLPLACWPEWNPIKMKRMYGFTKDWCYARELALSRLAGLQAHLLGDAAGPDWI